MLNICPNAVHRLLIATLACASPKLFALNMWELVVRVQAPFRPLRQLSRHRQVEEVFTSTIGLLLVVVLLRKCLMFAKLRLLLRKKKLSFLVLYRLMVWARHWDSDERLPTLYVGERIVTWTCLWLGTTKRSNGMTTDLLYIRRLGRKPCLCRLGRAALSAANIVL